MTVAHDMSPQGRLLELLALCEEHVQRGDFNRFPRLLDLIPQTRRIVGLAIKESFDLKQIEPQVKATPYVERPA